MCSVLRRHSKVCFQTVSKCSTLFCCSDSGSVSAARVVLAPPMAISNWRIKRQVLFSWQSCFLALSQVWVESGGYPEWSYNFYIDSVGLAKMMGLRGGLIEVCIEASACGAPVGRNNFSGHFYSDHIRSAGAAPVPSPFDQDDLALSLQHSRRRLQSNMLRKFVHCNVEGR